ncbi:CCNI protein, partial [Thinocorus orbignyianus]|nr:CCNI protein [Thinocorus orbignyianus]
QVIPSERMLVVQSGCERSPAEILRMERTRVEKLHWDLHTATPMDSMPRGCPNGPQRLPGLPQRNPSRHGALLTKQLQHWMACHQLLQLKGSTLVLVIITLELERLTPDWCPASTALLK